MLRLFCILLNSQGSTLSPIAPEKISPKVRDFCASNRKQFREGASANPNDTATHSFG